jgi:hypothetical protein
VTPTNLLESEPAIVNVGVHELARPAMERKLTVLDLEWQPPAEGQAETGWRAAMLASDPQDPAAAGNLIDAANAHAASRMLSARPILEDVALHASSVWPGLGRTLLHAGAPIEWDAMCGPMQGAAVGALLYEGWATSAQAAAEMLARGEVRFASCHDHAAVGPMAGIISPSMPVFVVRNPEHGNFAYTNMSEGIGKVLRFGANGPDVIRRLKWIETVLAPGLKAAIRAAREEIDLKQIQARALLMGDEVHSRNTAATLIFLSMIAKPLLSCGFERARAKEIIDFIDGNSQFFLNLSMVSAKTVMDAAQGVRHSSLVTAIARNGVTTAIRTSCMADRWFEAPSGMPSGLYFPGFKREDANPDLGDSAIVETAGFGGFSLASSPALMQLVGGTVSDALAASREMSHITVERNPATSIPLLDFAGSPAGIDIRKVVDTGIRPFLTTGIAHKEPGIGQIGAGMVRVPMECFVKATNALAAEFGL